MSIFGCVARSTTWRPVVHRRRSSVATKCWCGNSSTRHCFALPPCSGDPCVKQSVLEDLCAVIKYCCSAENHPTTTLAEERPKDSAMAALVFCVNHGLVSSIDNREACLAFLRTSSALTTEAGELLVSELAYSEKLNSPPFQKQTEHANS